MLYVFIAIIIICILLFVVALKIMDAAGISKRCEGDENLKFLKAKNFDNLNARPIDFKSDKGQTLKVEALQQTMDVIPAEILAVYTEPKSERKELIAIE